MRRMHTQTRAITATDTRSWGRCSGAGDFWKPFVFHMARFLHVHFSCFHPNCSFFSSISGQLTAEVWTCTANSVSPFKGLNHAHVSTCSHAFTIKARVCWPRPFGMRSWLCLHQIPPYSDQKWPVWKFIQSKICPDCLLCWTGRSSKRFWSRHGNINPSCLTSEAILSELPRSRRSAGQRAFRFVHWLQQE